MFFQIFITIHPSTIYWPTFCRFGRNFLPAFTKHSQTRLTPYYPLLTFLPFWAKLFWICAIFTLYYTFLIFLRFNKINFYIFSNFMAIHPLYYLLANFLAFWAKLFLNLRNFCPLLYLLDFFALLQNKFFIFFKISWRFAPSIIYWPPFSRFDRLIFKISPKVKVPSRFRDGTFALLLFRFLFCHTRYGNLHAEAEGVYKNLSVA